MKNIKRAVCLLSGGLDSTVSAAVAKDKGYKLFLLFIEYGQKTLEKERKCVLKLANYLKAEELKIIKLSWLQKFGGSALFDRNILLNEKNFRLEYVPFRNSIFLSAATALAEVVNAEVVVIGSSGGDHICPDNSPKYLKAFQKVISLGTMLKKDIKILAPLIKTNKTGALKIGKRLKVQFNLTWSCHNNTDLACGHCSNCLSRLEAFSANGIPDPILYKKS